MITDIAFIICGFVGAGIILIGGFYVLAPQVIAGGFGIPAEPPEAVIRPVGLRPWLQVKGVRDIGSGIFIGILLANRSPHLLGAFMAAASLIAIGDALIVLRSGGPRTTAMGVHGATAAVMLAASAALLLA
ncbi:DUF4267 domain-containing protein [Phenylobacterium sp.]|uniref:DUF4267 domain-containing protein n=1 Tax=Phenylobacterium sp. TaxID=1871053 RepID=UPI0012192D57|nr:DUF4267 domain-containing protein [Phenylobacterium sp.]THD60821.1 MAG: DUF4267 domain-containing protein [Phenylobacterium sp.]